MKILISFAISFTFFTIGLAQSPEDLLRDVRENVASTSQLRKALQKQDLNKFENICDDPWDTTLYLKHTKLNRCFGYSTPVGENGTIFREMIVRAIYKGEQIRYVRIEERIYDQKERLYKYDTLFRYIDSSYTAGILYAYNNLHHSDFTWRDLYEDNLDVFVIFPGLRAPNIIKDSNGVERLVDEPSLSRYMMKFLPLIKKRDHGTIVQHCKSFNPTRKAYGALCLYVLQQIKEPLTNEEKQLLKNICQSNETTEFSSGCYHWNSKKINTILTKNELSIMANAVMMEGQLDN
jgi:hypothetical protein